MRMRRNSSLCHPRVFVKISDQRSQSSTQKHGGGQGDFMLVKVGVIKMILGLILVEILGRKNRSR